MQSAREDHIISTVCHSGAWQLVMGVVTSGCSCCRRPGSAGRYFSSTHQTWSGERYRRRQKDHADRTWLLSPGIYCSLLLSQQLIQRSRWVYIGGTTAAAQPPFRLGDPALCGSRPLVTPKYSCRLGDLLCFLYVYLLCCCILCCLLFLGFPYFCGFFRQYFDTVGWVFWLVKVKLSPR